MTAIRPSGATHDSLAHLRDDPRLSMLARLQRSSPMLDAVIDEVRGRRIRIGDHWLADFASCNYLGFDLDPEIAAAIDEQVGRWGTHPSWSRLLGNPRLYPQIEERLTDLLDAPDSLVLPTITHIHTSVLPVLAVGGTVLLETQAHRTIYDGASDAAAAGAVVRRFRADDLDGLSDVLRGASAHAPRARRAPLRRRRPRLRCARRAGRRRDLAVRQPGQRRRAVLRRDLRRRRAGRRVLEGVLVAAGVPHRADLAQGAPQGGGAPL